MPQQDGRLRVYTTRYFPNVDVPSQATVITLKSGEERSGVDLSTGAGLDAVLGQKGVRRTDVAELARRACADPCIATNPRAPNRRDVEVIYEEAL